MITAAVAVSLLFAVPLVGTATETAATNETELDVVFVFDNSQSTNENRYHMAQEIGALAEAFDGAALDVRYGLVTYNESVRIQQPLTSEFDAFDRAMHFRAGGNVENASKAILAVSTLETRPDAETVVVLVTDEDDDGDEAAREAAVAALSGTHFIAVSPPSPAESSCAIHSPPCDTRTDNELRTVAERVEGEWIGINTSAATIVDRIGTDIATAFETSSTDNRTPQASFERTAASVNRTTVDVGQPVAVTVTVRNVGTAEGDYHAYLSSDGQLFQSENVTIPANESRTITLVHTFEAPGTYELLVTHEPVATVVVEPVQTSTQETTTQTVTSTEPTATATETTTEPVTTESVATTQRETRTADVTTSSSPPAFVLGVGGLLAVGVGIVAIRRL